MNHSQRALDSHEEQTARREEWARELVLCKGLPLGLLTLLVSMVGAYVVSQSIVVGIAFLMVIGFLGVFRWTVAKVRVWMGRRENRLPSLTGVKEELICLAWPDKGIRTSKKHRPDPPDGVAAENGSVSKSAAMPRRADASDTSGQ